MARSIDIQFQTNDTQQARLEKLRRLVDAINDLIRAVSSSGTTTTVTAPATTGLNNGTGVGVFRDADGNQLNFRSVLAGTGIAVTLVGDDIVVASEGVEQDIEPLQIAGAF